MRLNLALLQRAESGAAAPHLRLDGYAIPREREFFIDNLLVRIHFIIVMIGWTGFLFSVVLHISA